MATTWRRTLRATFVAKGSPSGARGTSGIEPPVRVTGQGSRHVNADQREEEIEFTALTTGRRNVFGMSVRPPMSGHLAVTRVAHLIRWHKMGSGIPAKVPPG